MTTRSTLTAKLTRRTSALVFATLAAALLLAGCGGAPKLQALTVNIQAAATVNPDMQGRPSPIVVQVLELRSADQFSRLDYFSLSNDIAASLAADLLNQQQLVMKPGENRIINLELNAQTTTLGFIAGYRDMDNAVWRQTVAVNEGVKSVSVKLEQQQLSAAASN